MRFGYFVTLVSPPVIPCRAFCIRSFIVMHSSICLLREVGHFWYISSWYKFQRSCNHQVMANKNIYLGLNCIFMRKFNVFLSFWNIDITESDEYKSTWPHEVLIQLERHMKVYENSIKILTSSP